MGYQHAFMTIIETQCLLVEAAALACKGMLTLVSELATNSPELTFSNGHNGPLQQAIV